MSPHPSVSSSRSRSPKPRCFKSCSWDLPCMVPLIRSKECNKEAQTLEKCGKTMENRPRFHKMVDETMGKLKSFFSQFKKPWKGCLGLETAPESLPPTVEVKISAHERPLLLHRRQRPRKQPQLSLELPEASNSGACRHHSIHSDAWSF